MAGDLTQEDIELQEQLLEMLRQGKQLTEDQKEQLKELLGLQGKRLGSLKAEEAALEGQLGKYAKLRESDDKRVLMAQTARDLAKTKLDILKRELQNAEEIDDKLQEQFEKAVENLKVAEKSLEVAKGTTEAIKQGVQAGQELGNALGSAFGAYGQHPFFNAKTIGNLGKVVRGLGDKSFKPLDALMGGMVAGSLAAIAGSFINLIFEMDKVQRQFIAATGASEEYADSLSDVYVETRALGVEMKDVSESMQSLYTTYTDFTMLSRAQREELVKTSAVLNKVGVANEDFATGMQLQTKVLGESTASARANSLELADLARVIGVTPQQMAKDFAQAGDGVAKLGAQGVRAFKDLAIVSKTTGLEINKLLAITDKFDTFEGAADQAGKLNAALGGNFVNAMDLMTATDPVERFGMIRDAILDTGLTFDDMSYYQRIFYKDALGLNDVSDLALMLSGDMSTLAGSTQKTSAEYKKAAKEAERVQDITNQFKTAMMDLIPVASELITEFRAYTAELKPGSEGMKELRAGVGAFTAALKFVIKALLVVSEYWELFFGAYVIAGIVRLGLKLKVFQGLVSKLFKKTIKEGADEASKATSKMGEGTASAINKVGSAATANAVGIGALAGAIVAVGAAVALAAFGLSYLVDSFAQVGDNAGWAVVGILAVLVALGSMIAGLAALAPLAAVGAAPLWALAGAILAIGGAVFLAAVGIGLMAGGLATMFEAMSVEKMLAFMGFIAVVAAATYFLAPAGAAVLWFAASLGALMLAMKLFTPDKEMAIFSKFFESFAAVGGVAGELHKVALAIGKINSQLKELPETKAVEFTTTMNALTNATVAANARGATATAAAANTANVSAGATDRPYEVKLELTLDGEILDKRVVKLMSGKLSEGALV